jgi:tetratricopeptide (TPR) repeat protein
MCQSGINTRLEMNMDVWAWLEDVQEELIESGQGRVAQLIDRLPSAVAESDPIAEALAPELIAAAKAMGNPWLEVYARHWQLQYLVGTENHGTRALQFATESLERAHRPETMDCPQSVCTTQDISMTYEAIDRYSFAADREAVSRETLARVTPRWNCFDCIHRALIDALADQGRIDEALELLDTSRNQLEAVGNDPSPGYLVSEASLYLQKDRADLATQICERGEEHADEEPATTQMSRRILWTTAERRLENFESAVSHFPEPEAILNEKGLSASWAKELLALVRAGAMANSPLYGQTLETLLQHSDRVGSLRATIEIGNVHALLAADRGVAWVGEEAVEVMERARKQLREDHGAQALIDEAKAATRAVTPQALPVPIDELGNYLNTADTAAELDVMFLRQAIAAEPENLDLPLYLGMAYANAAQDSLLLRQFTSLENTPISATPGYLALVRCLLNSKLPAADVDREITAVAERLIANPDADKQFVGHRMKADHAYWRDRYAECVAACELALEISSDAMQTRHLLATAAIRNKQFAKAVTHLRVLIEANDEPGDLVWDLMTASTALGDWATVREFAAKAEIPVPEGSGPIDEDIAFCQVLLPGYNGGLAPWSAVRTGPATARVVEVSNPQAPFQHFDARVVIDVGAVNLADREEEGDQWTPIFPVVDTMKEGTHRGWILDGAAPTDEQWAEFRDTLRDEQWGVWSATWPDYKVTDPTRIKKQIAGMYVFVASPPHVSAVQADERLRTATATWKHPWAWLSLAQEADADVAHHQSIIDRYDL